MSGKTFLASAVILFLGAEAGTAAPGMLDLIPQDAAAGLAIRNITDFKKKADKLITEVEPNAPFRAASLFGWVYGYLGIGDGLDEDNAGAAVLANPKTAGLKNGLQDPRDFEQLLVLVVPFSDRDKMAANFGFKKGALQPGRMAAGKGKNFGKFFYARGKHLFLGNNEKAVASVAQGKPLAGDLTDARRKSLAGADLLVHVGPSSWEQEWGEILKNLEAEFGRNGEKDEKEVVREFFQSLAHVRHGFASVRLDGGLGVSLLGVFPRDGDAAAQKLLKLLAAGGGPSRLNGLPEGNVLAALAAGGDGTKNALVAKVLLNFLLHNSPQINTIIAPADRPGFVGLFTEVWQRLKGSRGAVYQNEAEAKHGLLSVVTVLDTEDADRFIADMRELAHIADGTALDLKTKTGRDSAGPKVEALIRDLGDRRFRVRQSATTKLRLMGEAALPFLEKALTSPDREVSHRAQRLQDEIQKAAVQRRKDLLATDLPRLVKPTFAFIRQAETRSGCRVHVVTVKLSGKDAASAPRFKQLFGPDWDKIRLGVHGKQVVALLGSDVRLLDETLANLQGGKAGLAGAAALTAFDRQRPGSRKFEFHISLEKVLALVRGPRGNQPAAKPAQAFSSGALTLEKDLVQVDFRLAISHLKVIARGGELR